jgi:hypothetical protein
MSDPEGVDGDAAPQSHVMPEDAEIWTGKIEATNVWCSSRQSTSIIDIALD